MEKKQWLCANTCPIKKTKFTGNALKESYAWKCKVCRKHHISMKFTTFVILLSDNNSKAAVCLSLNFNTPMKRNGNQQRTLEQTERTRTDSTHRMSCMEMQTV